ncbi:MAG: response regulator [Bacteroidales bacterium]|nr:response regulator [Bacteroidales bacterium]MCF8392206.1 response regulator [Bacteroidales bacterium]
MTKLNILIVDDIFTNRLLLSELIKTLGHQSVQAENGQEAVNCLEKEDFDLILMDIEMPVMNGVETCQYIRTKMPSPKSVVTIVALTAHNPAIFFEDFSDAGFDELLTKPYSLDKLIELINNIT